jgi:hypothetical protein
MKPLLDLFHKYNHQEKPILIIDPFARNCRLAHITNDLDPKFDTDFNLDAIDFLKVFPSESVDMLIYDAPWTSRQVSECYTRLDRTVTKYDTSSKRPSDFKKAISRVIKVGGIVISCGYDSNGIGKSNGFEVVEGLNICHGASHYDSIITIERKIQGSLF